MLDGAVGDALHLGAVAHVGHHEDGGATAGVDLLGDGSEYFFIARGEDHPGAACGGHPRGGQADAAGGPGDDDGLFG